MKRKKSDKETEVPPEQKAAAPVVGIGASAGGLEALREIFAAMPSDSGMAFVVIQHLDPSYESRTAEILSKHIAMPVVEAKDGMPVQANHIYTNPADKYVALQDSGLKLSEPVPQEGIRKPIDFLFNSLAEERREKAIGIMLSGSSGSDGLRGVRAIRTAGGICLAQEPQSARFAEMPRSIIEAGLADYVLPVEQMPQALLAYVRNVHVQPAIEDERPSAAATGDLESILDLLRTRARSDFRHYKKATLLRRIRRRMAFKQAGDMAAYLKLLQAQPDELAQLARDMLIGVSAFFRDPEAFEELRREIIVPLAAGRDAEAPLRAWVAGCATGEEAYSVAMLLLEAVADAKKSCPVQIFASDPDEPALETARAGIYPATIAEDVSPERLKRFFKRQGDKWQVNKPLREAVIFSRHNLLTDPPFSKLDLVSCRNVLIYLEPAAQKKVLTLFSFALNPGGCLFLGKSEGVSGLDEELFEAVSRQKRIFRLLRANRRGAGEFPVYAGGGPLGFVPRGRSDSLTHALAEANQEALLRHFQASLVLADPKGRILYFHGRTEKYLGHPEGPASLNLLDLTEGLLSAKLRRALDTAAQKNEVVSLPGGPMPNRGGELVNLTVLPVAAPALGGQVLAVIFQDAQPAPHASAAPLSAEDESLVAQLEAEVKALRGELRSDAEEYGTSSDELKAANEEITSMNEELQSANEELEASKEELQSLNEELTTVNSQLSENLAELTAINNDLANLMSATQIATLFLDRQLKIKRFTPRATELLNLIPSDLGRPINHITQNFAGDALAAHAKTVLETLTPVETDVRAQSGRWFTTRVMPYRTLEDRIEGVVITFSDVSRPKEMESGLEREKAYAQGIVETVRSPLLALDAALRVISANQAFYETFETRPEETVGRRFYDLGDRRWDIPQLRELLQEVIPKKTAFQDFEVEHDFPRIGRRTMILNGRRMVGIEGERILLALEDITARKKDRAALEALNQELEQRIAERTALTERLRGLASELTRVEQRERERLARVLHDDLQQLLVSAQYHLSRVRSKAPDPATRDAVEQVEDLLLQSIRASRALTADLSPTILYEAGLDAALPWLARQMKEKFGLEVSVQIGASVKQDEEGMAILLFHAVRELLFNVVKHAGVKEAAIQLDRLKDDLVRIVVSDQGAGFDASRLPAGVLPGKGLGLFGLRERMEHLGGSMAIESAPGRGTRVTLIARVRQPEAAAAPARNGGTSAAPSPAAEAPPGRRKFRVLLVDDHVIVRQGLAGILRQFPEIEIVGEASDGLEAVEEAERLQPDVVVMDISMSRMNGVEATEVIHAAQPQIRIIGLSMYEEADRAAAMLKAGAAAYFSKDGPPEKLVEAIRKNAE